MIVLALYMPDICGEFRDICKVSLLPARPVLAMQKVNGLWSV